MFLRGRAFVIAHLVQLDFSVEEAKESDQQTEGEDAAVAQVLGSRGDGDGGTRHQALNHAEDKHAAAQHLAHRNVQPAAVKEGATGERMR